MVMPDIQHSHSYGDLPAASTSLAENAERTNRPKRLRRATTNPELAPSNNSDSDSESNRGSYSSLRRPYHNNETGWRQTALALRYRYYSRLDPRGDGAFRMPDNIVPTSYFSVTPFGSDDRQQSSIITIFSVWNSMVGACLLSMPWAFGQAGFALGIFFLLSLSVLAFYTAYRVIVSPHLIEKENFSSSFIEFSDVCKYFFGKWGEYTSMGFSFLSLLGGIIVYYVLMCNFLYYTVNVIYESLQVNSTELSNLENPNHTLKCDVYCVGSDSPGSAVNVTTFYKVWQLDRTVPLFIILLIFPLVNFESPTFFTKFNGLGTISIMYLLIFVILKISECGWHVDFSDISSKHYVPAFVWPTFPALTGTLSLSYFVHNIIIAIMRNQKNPKNNPRDLSLAYCLVTVTYSVIGVGFYAAFPTYKSCIGDNFLNNFGTGDLLSSIARLFLLFQMTTVYPLMLYLLRIQVMYPVFGSIYPSAKHVFVLNISVILICIFFAIVLPQVGTIVRFVGAICGLAYMFVLPCLVYLANHRKHGTLKWYHIGIHGFIMLIGVANFIAQFAIL